MTNKEKFETIIKTKSNNNTLNQILELIKRCFNVDNEEIKSKPKYYVQEMLYKIRANNSKIYEIEKSKESKRRDLKDLECGAVSSVSYDANAGGHNNGGKPNAVLNNLELQLMIEEDIRHLIAESVLMQKKLECDNKLIDEFIDLIPNHAQRQILKGTYFRFQDYIEIANELNYSPATIMTSKRRAISNLTSILKRYIESVSI